MPAGWIFCNGQLWGNPLYSWDIIKAPDMNGGYQTSGICFRLYDVVRIDHFRGFDEYFSIPYGAETAVDGHWEKGPGMDLFRKVEEALGGNRLSQKTLDMLRTVYVSW